MSAPTPGPWVVNRGEWAHITNPLYSGLVALIEHSDDVPLFVCNADQPVDKEEYEANARLVAAAPDLLAACKEAETWPDRFEQGPDYHAFRKQLADAIAKAEGK